MALTRQTAKLQWQHRRNPRLYKLQYHNSELGCGSEELRGMEQYTLGKVSSQIGGTANTIH